MPRYRTPIEAAAGRLVSSIQKEWIAELGDDSAPVCLSVMDAAHELLKAATREKIAELLGGRTIMTYLGEAWVNAHPAVGSAIAGLEAALDAKHSA